MAEDLDDHLRSFSTAPFLFVGSGMSRRYLGLDDWESLLRRFAAEVGKPYEYFASAANGDKPRSASLIAEEFHEIWWTEEKWEESRDRQSSDAVRSDSPLKIAVADYITSSEVNSHGDPILDEELTLLEDAVIDGIITTNWDTFLSETFPDYRIFVGQNGLLFQDPQGVGEIYYIHGYVEEVNSLVLTEEDYRVFVERNPYLAAKLLSIFVEHPVIFLGYSLSDPNVIAILRSIASCLTAENLEKLQDRLVFVQWDEDSGDVDDVKLRPSQTTVDGWTIPIMIATVRDFRALFQVLSALDRKFPARMLRQLKEHIFELVRDNDPVDQLHVLELASDDATKVDVVYGVGASGLLGERGYRPVVRSDIIDEVLHERDDLDPARVLHDSLPNILRSARYCPVFKYLAADGRVSEDGVDLGGLDEKVLKAAGRTLENYPPVSTYGTRGDKLGVLSMSGIEELRRTLGDDGVFHYATMLPREALSVDELRACLIDIYSRFASLDGYRQSQFVKLVCVLDRLHWGPKA